MRDAEISNTKLLFDAVRDVVGEDGIEALQQYCGGTAMWVPGVRLRENSPIAEAIGMDAASAVVAKLQVVGADGRMAGGFEVYIRQGGNNIVAKAKAEAVKAVRGGMTRVEAAAHVGLSVSTVSHAVNRHCAETGESFTRPKPTRPEPRSRPIIAPTTSEPIRPRRPTREEQEAELVRLYAIGLSPHDIAERMGWKVNYVYCRFWRLRRETGLTFIFDRKPGQDLIWGEHRRTRSTQVEACLARGLSIREIAEELGISLTSVKNYRAKLRRTTGLLYPPCKAIAREEMVSAP